MFMWKIIAILLLFDVILWARRIQTNLLLFCFCFDGYWNLESKEIEDTKHSRKLVNVLIIYYFLLCGNDTYILFNVKKTCSSWFVEPMLLSPTKAMLSFRKKYIEHRDYTLKFEAVKLGKAIDSNNLRKAVI